MHRGEAQEDEDGLRCTSFVELVPECMLKEVLADFRYTSESRTVGLFEEVTEEVVADIWWKNRINPALASADKKEEFFNCLKEQVVDDKPKFTHLKSKRKPPPPVTGKVVPPIPKRKHQKRDVHSTEVDESSTESSSSSSSSDSSSEDEISDETAAGKFLMCVFRSSIFCANYTPFVHMHYFFALGYLVLCSER